MGGLYRHYKGGMYRVLNMGTHSETQEKLVVYMSLENGKIWIRPADMFFQYVEVDGERIQRFQHIEEPE